MSDERLRELERRWLEGADPGVGAELLSERRRAGLCTVESIELLAALGSPAAAQAWGAGREPDLLRGLQGVGQEAAVRVALAATSLTSAGWYRSRSFRERAELATAFAAAREWALAATDERAREARATALALERVLPWPRDRDAPDDRRARQALAQAGRPVERAAACALAAAFGAGWGAGEGQDPARAAFVAGALAAHAARVAEEEVGRVAVHARARELVEPWTFGLPDRVRELALRPARPSGRSRPDPAGELLERLRALAVTPPPRTAPLPERNAIDGRRAATPVEFGERVADVLAAANGRFGSGRVEPLHVALVVDAIDGLREREGLTWFWIDGGQLAAAGVEAPARATLGLVVLDAAAAEVRVQGYFRPRPSEATNAWGYSTGGSPCRLALAVRSRADAVRGWSKLGPVARASVKVARSWARGALGSDEADPASVT